MIAKCVALLAVVAQINAFAFSNCGRAGVLGASTCNARNIVARGRYPIAVDNIGPVPDGRVPVTTSVVQAPLQVKPTVRLPANIPCPRTLAHHCTCYKTILRPRVHDQVITVPSVQRYIETSHTPVVENIHYEAVPVNAGCGCGAAVAPIAPIAPLAPACAPVAAAVAPVVPVTSSCAQVAPVYSGCGLQSFCC